MKRVLVLLLFGVWWLTSCSTPLSQDETGRRFTEEDRADVVVRYYSDQTSYVLKPRQTEGPFLSILNRNAVVDLAKSQPGRDLAVVIMISYTENAKRASVRREWRELLGGIGFQRVLFLRAESQMKMKINGLMILEDDVQWSQSPQPDRLARAPAGKT